MIVKSVLKYIFRTDVHTKYLLQRRVSSWHSSSKMAKRFAVQNYDYFLVLDFEATCDNSTILKPEHEIIEFPVLKVGGKSFEIEATFHQYVEPYVNKNLTTFCAELTGIIQEMVDGQPNLEDSLKSFDKWMGEQGLLEQDVRSIFVTCGEWDLKNMLPSQCRTFHMNYPGYLKKWINIKKPYCEATGVFPKGMMHMLKGLNLTHEGRHHSGIDDCKNITNILKALAEKGVIFNQTGQL